MFWSAGCSLWRVKGFFCSLDVIYGGQRTCKLQFLIFLKSNFFPTCKFVSVFWSSKPWILIVIQHKCWIRIRTQWIRIRNTDNNNNYESKGLLLMYVQYWAVGCHFSSLSPSLLVLLILSLPARSQKLSMDTLQQVTRFKRIFIKKYIFATYGTKCSIKNSDILKVHIRSTVSMWFAGSECRC